MFDTQAVMERDEEIKRTREEALRTQRNLEEQLAEERGSAHDNQVITATTITRLLQLQTKIGNYSTHNNQVIAITV